MQWTPWLTVGASTLGGQCGWDRSPSPSSVSLIASFQGQGPWLWASVNSYFHGSSQSLGLAPSVSVIGTGQIPGA